MPSERCGRCGREGKYNDDLCGYCRHEEYPLLQAEITRLKKLVTQYEEEINNYQDMILGEDDQAAVERNRKRDEDNRRLTARVATLEGALRLWDEWANVTKQIEGTAPAKMPWQEARAALAPATAGAPQATKGGEGGHG